MKIIEAIKRIKLCLSNKWEFNDYFINVKNIVDEQKCPIEDSDNKTNYICLRDYEGFNLYIQSKDIDNIYKIKSIYNYKYNLLNISELRRHKTRRNVLGLVYNSTSPATVKIKCIEYIHYKEYTMYLVYVIDLNYNDNLYADLLNYKYIENKC